MEVRRLERVLPCCQALARPLRRIFGTFRLAQGAVSAANKPELQQDLLKHPRG